MALFGAFLPLALVHCAIRPLAETFTGHLAFDPLSLILPALYCAHEQTDALLKSVRIISLVKISVLPLADAAAVWEAMLELSEVDLALLESQLTASMHRTFTPVALVNLAIGVGPVLLSESMRLALHERAFVLGAV